MEQVSLGMFWTIILAPAQLTPPAVNQSPIVHVTVVPHDQAPSVYTTTGSFSEVRALFPELGQRDLDSAEQQIRGTRSVYLHASAQESHIASRGFRKMGGV